MGLGWKPIFDVIELTRGDWIFERSNPAGPFPPATTARVEWASGQNWDGAIAGNVVSWRVESAEADLIADNTDFTIWVRYPNGVTETTDDYPWIYGRARRTKTVRN